MNSTEFKSNEERYFAWYLEELVDTGYIQKFSYEPESIQLSPTLFQFKETPLKTKIKTTRHKLLSEHIYTPDFKIWWEEKAEGIFHSDSYTGTPFAAIQSISYIETKGTFDPYNMTRLFRINQKWCYDKYKIFINLIIPTKLFKETFTPKRFLFTDIQKRVRNIPHKIIMLDEYINKRQEYRTTLNSLRSNT